MKVVFADTQSNNNSTPIAEIGLPVSALAGLTGGGSICTAPAMYVSLPAEGFRYKDQQHNKRRSRKMG